MNQPERPTEFMRKVMDEFSAGWTPANGVFERIERLYRSATGYNQTPTGTRLVTLMIEDDRNAEGNSVFQLYLVVNGSSFPIGGQIKADDLLDACHVFARKLTRALQ
jgi:hypothetical protein